MNDELMTLADLRKKAGLTQPQVAERMGVSRTQVSRIEAKYPEVMFRTLRNYLDALGMDMCFIGGGGNVESSQVVKDTSRDWNIEAGRMRSVG